MNRPYPPEEFLGDYNRKIMPAPDLQDWIRENFINPDGPLYGEEHSHLEFAVIGTVWANVENSRKGRTIIGQAELPMQSAMGGKWLRARIEQQLLDWFGEVPDFLITIDAQYAAVCSDIDLAALIDHELNHCVQDTDQYGMPKFSKTTGRPSFTIQGHDVEEFVSVVRRFGAGPDVQALVDAANGKPEVGVASVAKACGTCIKAVA